MSSEANFGLAKEVKAISEYAKAYKKLETLQRDSTRPWFPIGDQKTGAIGEFYAIVYFLDLYGKRLEIMQPGNKDFDLKAGGIRIQVKTVSEFSSTKRVSPIKTHNVDLILLIYLDRDFFPKRVYTVDPCRLHDNIDTKHVTMRTSDKAKGSKIFDYSEEITDVFIPIIQRNLGNLT